MERWLVTGGLGFIGAHVTQQLLQRPAAYVLILDKMTYAAVDGLRLEGLGLAKHPRLEVLQGGAEDLEAVQRAARSIRPHYWIHLAAESHVDRSLDDPLSFVTANVLGTQACLAVASGQKSEQPRFCYVSTDEVYGPLPEGYPEDAPGVSEDAPLNPGNPYSASKAAAELLVLAASKSYGLDVVLTRGCNSYGPWQSVEKFIPRLVGLALLGRPLPVYGDGLQQRQWMRVEDHARGVIQAALLGRSGEIYNLGAPCWGPNLRIAQQIARMTSVSVELVADRPGHDRGYRVCSLKAQRELGWSAGEHLWADLPRLLGWHQRRRWWLQRQESLLGRQGLGGPSREGNLAGGRGRTEAAPVDYGAHQAPAADLR